MPVNIDKMRGMKIDSSLSYIDASVTVSEYQERLISLLQDILQKQFPRNVGKQKIRTHKDRITFSCPYCGDSMKSDYKHRGNFILSGKFANFFKCFNCGIFKPIDKFFNDFKVNLDLNIINYISNNTKDFSTHTNVKYDLSLFLDMESIDKYAIDRNEFLKYFGLSEVKDSAIWPWLVKRMQYDTNKFMYNSKTNDLIILNLTHSGKILGIQKRTFKGHNKYLTYKLTALYELMHKDPKIIPDEIDILSQLFNICLVDYSKTITLFEGAFDAFLFKNSIANAGANKGFPLDVDVRYFYDDDSTGREKSIEKINEGKQVFLWQKFIHDNNIPYKDKHDLNDIFIWAKEKNVKLTPLQNYFSNNPLDIIDI